MAARFERLILHVGMHKTGSTALQEMLHRMRWGRAGPMDMIDLNHSVPCALWFGSAFQQERMLLNFGHDEASAKAHLEAVQARVMRQLRTSRKRDLVISAEWLSDGHYMGEGRHGMLRRLQETFAEHFKAIQVYGYVRPPIAFATSACLEMMKMRPGLNLPWPHYRRRFGPLCQVFGQENVHLRLYDRALLKNADVVADFQEWMGWPQKPVQIDNPNHALSAPAAALIYCYQINQPLTQTVEDHARKLENVAALTEIEGPRVVLSDALVHPLLEKNADDLAWIEKMMKRPVGDQTSSRPHGCIEVWGEDHLKRLAARFAPLMDGNAPTEPPRDPQEANAVAWSALKKRFQL